MNLITPTVGRKVWFRPCLFDMQGVGAMAVAPGQPLDATILAVWNDRMVNVLVHDIHGKPFPKSSVDLLQPGDNPPLDEHGTPRRGYVEWMPFQAGQAKAAQGGA